MTPSETPPPALLARRLVSDRLSTLPTLPRVPPGALRIDSGEGEAVALGLVSGAQMAVACAVVIVVAALGLEAVL